MRVSISRAKLSMGANESRDLKSIGKILFGLFVLFIHFAFVIVSKFFDFWRSLAQNKGLQSELEATNKDGECVRQRLRFQDAQLEKLKERQDLSADEESKKYGKHSLGTLFFNETFMELLVVALEQQYRDTVERLQKMQSLAGNLNVQLAQASVDVERLRQERDEILDKLTVQEKLLRDILTTASEEREQIVAKMKHDFEQLRNVNSDREEHLMEDCEWKLRQMMKQCKEKIDKAEKEKLALKDQAQMDRQTIRSQRDEIKSLKACEEEANQLRGLTNDQKDTLTTMMKRIDDLKTDLANTKRRLQDEIDSCLQIKRDCA
jgi:chromosome segregation ATPase